MTLAIAQEEIDDFASAMVLAGIAEFDQGWRGLEVVYNENVGPLTHSVLDLIRERTATIDGRDSRKQFLELLGKALKKHHERAKQKAKAEPVATQEGAAS